MSNAGRPTDFTQELADVICARLSEGESMRSIALDDDMPVSSTMFLWLRTHKEFSEQYARAKMESADAMAEDILDIADSALDEIHGDDRSDGARVQAIRLKVDTRKFLMSKMKPKKYGDKLDLTSDGERIKASPIIVSTIKSRKKEEDAETEAEASPSS